MRVWELIQLLRDMPSDALVILAEDSEGNGYSPLDAVEKGGYAAETSWSGEWCGLDEIDEDGVELAVLLTPYA